MKTSSVVQRGTCSPSGLAEQVFVKCQMQKKKQRQCWVLNFYFKLHNNIRAIHLWKSSSFLISKHISAIWFPWLSMKKTRGCMIRVSWFLRRASIKEKVIGLQYVGKVTMLPEERRTRHNKYQYLKMCLCKMSGHDEFLGFVLFKDQYISPGLL